MAKAFHNSDPNWANQTKDELFNLSYQTPLEERRVSNIHSQTNSSSNMLMSYIDYAYTTPPTAPTVNSDVSSLPYDMC